MRIRMLTDRRGSESGVTNQLYKAGETYNLSPSLAVPWLAKGYCEQDKMMPGPSEVKDEAQSKDGDGGRTGKPGREKRRKGK